MSRWSGFWSQFLLKSRFISWKEARPEMADTRPDKVIDQRSLFSPDGAPAGQAASAALRDRGALELITGAPPGRAEDDGVGPALRRSPDLCSAQMASHEMQRKSAEKITRLLEKATYASRPSRVFEDWLRLVEASLDMLPAHLASAAQHGRLAEDPPEIARLFEELRARYRPQDFERFSEALGILLDDSAAGYMDVIGQVYMDFANPNPGNGQYFTPIEVCALLGAVSICEKGEEAVRTRLMEAIEQAPPLEAALAQAGLLSGLLFDENEPGALEWFVSRVLLPILPYYKPITVCDPCVGSGRMLLAAAACFPAYAVHLGLVRFYAADIDPLCVAMARTNVLLYGLNGTGLRYAQALAQANAEAMPPLEAAGGHVQSLDCLTAEPAVSSPKKKPRRARRPTPPPTVSTPAQRARKSILVMEDATPEKIMAAVQLDLFDWSSAGRVPTTPKAPDSLSGKRCVVCQASPQARPGTWYVIDGAAYCPNCVPAIKAGEQREMIEVRHG
jgi:hypothetical protein